MGDSTTEVFLNNSKTPQDNELTFCNFNFIFATHFAYVDNINCSKMLSWQPFVSSVSHHFMRWKNDET